MDAEIESRLRVLLDLQTAHTANIVFAEVEQALDRNDIDRFEAIMAALAARVRGRN